MVIRRVAILVVLLIYGIHFIWHTTSRRLTASDTVLSPPQQTDAKTLQPFFAKHCFSCHGLKKQRGDLRLDTLPTDFTGEHLATWTEILDRLKSGEMPPKSRPRPAATEVNAVMSWITEKLSNVKQGHVVMRRLNRTEYENTLHDLLAIDTPLKEMVPEDGQAHGFDNVGAALTLSSVLMERYLEAADVALRSAVVSGERPKTFKKKVSYKHENGIKRGLGRHFLALGDTIVMFNSGYSPTVLYHYRTREPGLYRIRISAYAYQSQGKPVTMRLYGGRYGRETNTHLIGFYDVTAKPTLIEVVDRLDADNTIQVIPHDLGQRQIPSAKDYKGRGLAVQWVEVEGPMIKAWPPESHRRIFGETDGTKGTVKDAEAILRKFLPKAFRRPIDDDDVRPYLALIAGRLKNKYTFRDAVRVGLQAVLCSPDFLFLRERPGKLDDFALANRLSYFLWSSMPDDELFRLAKAGELGKSEVLRQQVERMLKHAKAKRFRKNFTGQWLDLRKIDFTTPDSKLYPEFDELLHYSMVQETELFFAEILRNNLSLLNFIDADFSMLNERLARHYNIPGVVGQHFRKVKLPANSHRGGVLTHASVLRVTANGTTTSPVLRGVWVLDRILGKPVPPPPANVPAVEPDIRGAKSIHEQLAKHRSITSCASCHAKIDPVGFALENFDVIGGWRDHYRVINFKAKRPNVTIHGRPVRYRIGPQVDAGDVMPNGKRFQSFDEFQKLLLADKEQIVRGLTEKLLIYATGSELAFRDRAVVDGIVQRVRRDHFGLRSLIHEIVQSERFRSK